MKVVVNGAGAAAVSCAKLYIALGVEPKNMVMCDSKGVLSVRRKDLNPTKARFATSRDVNTLEEAVKGADVFLGLSVADVLTSEMVQSMAKNPIVFALANPNPEIRYEVAHAARPDIIFATGRSDYPNQVNNVLAFPGIFRGALDVRASEINDEMKVAAAYAIAGLVSDEELNADYILPAAFDSRVKDAVANAVAEAARKSGVARI